ncbi:Lrp/AsnC family transcriptional regulator [Pseudoxanthobacter sp.]|uniref:Lrp/AsnC family transcriptional regulator n=1 Tax=Pseudoxanthobacter sp. TaxID=1925742 RepID=UPI002FE38266
MVFPSMGTSRLDQIDMNILTELQRSGRMTNAELADRVGLSSSPCLLRVKRLQKAGFITGYHAALDLKKLGETVTVFLEVTLSDHRINNFTVFEQGLRRFGEVMECHLVSGGFDYMVRLLVRDLTHFQTVVERLLEANLGIARYFSYIVVKTPIARSEAPLKSLFGADDE